MICWDRLVKDDIDLLSRFVRRRVDGLLLLPMECPPSPSHIAQLHSFHNPVVLIDQVWRGSDFDYVGSDNRGGAAALVERLIAAGRRRIGSVIFTEVSSGEERRTGFLDAMFRHNMPVDARFLCKVTDSKSSYEEIRKLLSAEERPDALVCFNDYLANDALNAAFDLGIRVPEELAITGFGNLPICEKLRPALTTVDQHAGLIGQTAARLLMERITGNETGPCRELLVPANPVYRQSCGCAL